jgi:Ca2+-binding EF-hand superfamily protein
MLAPFLAGTDPENTLMMAFKMFDEDNKEYIDEA